MTKILLDEVREGMTLLAECADNRGNVLIKKGMVLSSDWIERLRSRGITHVDVETSEDEGSQSSKMNVEDLQTRMKFIFAPSLGKPHMTPLAKATYAFFRGQG